MKIPVRCGCWMSFLSGPSILRCSSPPTRSRKHEPDRRQLFSRRDGKVPFGQSSLPGIYNEQEMSVPQRGITNPEELEVAPGRERENLEGWIPQLASDEEIRLALEKAFDYRGDITLTLKSGEKVEGYIFDRRTGKTLLDSSVRLYPKTGNQKLIVSYADIA